MAKQKCKRSCEKCVNVKKTGRPRSKRATTRRRLRFLFVNKRRPFCSREFRRRTLQSSLKSVANSMPWLPLLLLEPRLLETHLDLVLTALVVRTEAKTLTLRVL